MKLEQAIMDFFISKGVNEKIVNNPRMESIISEMSNYIKDEGVRNGLTEEQMIMAAGAYFNVSENNIIFKTAQEPKQEQINNIIVKYINNYVISYDSESSMLKSDQNSTIAERMVENGQVKNRTRQYTTEHAYADSGVEIQKTDSERTLDGQYTEEVGILPPSMAHSSTKIERNRDLATASVSMTEFGNMVRRDFQLNLEHADLLKLANTSGVALQAYRDYAARKPNSESNLSTIDKTYEEYLKYPENATPEMIAEKDAEYAHRIEMAIPGIYNDNIKTSMIKMAEELGITVQTRSY